MDHRQRATLSRSLARKELTNSEHDISQVQGNLSEEGKQHCLDVFLFYVSTPRNSFGAELGERLKLVEVSAYTGRENTSIAETVFEVTIGRDMCNIFQILHGACAAYIVDLCSVSALVALGTVLGFDATGVSQSMSLIWHNAIRLGEVVKVVSNSMSVKGKVRTMRCELWCNKTLCISAVHSTVHINKKSYVPSKAKL